MGQQDILEQQALLDSPGQVRETQPKAADPSWHTVARWTWRITSWIWTAILIEFLIQLIPNLLTIVDPVQSLRSTWVAIAVRWLLTSNSQPGWEIVRWTAIVGVLLLILLPIITSATRRIWQEKAGLEKLIEVIQQDTLSPQLKESLDTLIEITRRVTLSPQLKELQQHVQQLLASMDACAKLLVSIYTLLQQAPPFSQTQKSLQTLEESLNALARTLQASPLVTSHGQESVHTSHEIRKNRLEHAKHCTSGNNGPNQRTISEDMTSTLRLFTHILAQNPASISTANE